MWVSSPVTPHPGKLSSYPQIRNSSISLQTQQPGNKNADPPSRCRPARCGIPNPTVCLLVGRGSWSQHAARVPPPDNAEDLPHPRIKDSHPRVKSPSTSLQLQHPGHDNADPRSIPPRTVWKPQPNWLVADWLGLMEPAGGEGCPSIQGRGCAAHGNVKVPSPDQKSFHTSTVPTNREPRW